MHIGVANDSLEFTPYMQTAYKCSLLLTCILKVRYIKSMPDHAQLEYYMTEDCKINFRELRNNFSFKPNHINFLLSNI